MDNKIPLALAAIVVAAVGFLLYRGVSEPQTADPEPIPTEAPAPKHPWPDVELQGAELKSAVVTPGAGDSPRSDQIVEASWKGWVLKTEASFPETKKTFVLSKSPAVAGVNAALALMKPGETRLLQLPPALAFGQTGTLQVPKDAEVMMLVTLHRVSDAVTAPEKPAEATAALEDNGVKYAILTPGMGAQAKAGDQVWIHFSMFLEDGTRLDSTHTRHVPIGVTVGKGEVFAGIDQSLASMKVGEKRKLIVPPALGAGKEGRGPIPPNSTLIFEVELVRIK